MAEISHRALRELIEGFMDDSDKPRYSGATSGDTGQRPEYVTEMLSAGAVLGGGPFEAWYLDAGPCPRRLVYQLTGSNPAQLEGAAALLDQRDCLGIDLNMGCAAPAIRRTGAGIAWMGDMDRARAMVSRVRKAVKRRLSVKLRLGPPKQESGTSEQGFGGPGPLNGAIFEYLVRFCRALEAEGVQLITLHPRLAGEKFKRRARWEYVEALRRELSVPVAGNGDIDDTAALLRRAAGGRVMVGRAAVRQPWIFAEARLLAAGGSPTGPRTATGADAGVGAGAAHHAGNSFGPVNRSIDQSIDQSIDRSIDLEETALRFLELLTRYQPPEFHISRARRFFNYFCDNLTWGTHVKNLLNREKNLQGIERTWREYFASHPEELYTEPFPC
jgi:tRNA-dihydrouridine synthase